MANLKEIRLRIQSVKSTQQLTKAMKMVAAAKLKKAQNRMLALRPYANKLQEIKANVTAAVDASEIPSDLVNQREVKNVLILLVTSDRGLCGPFNSGIIKHAEQFIADNYATEHAEGRLQILAVGRKGFDFFNRRDFNLVDNKNFEVFGNLGFDVANEVVDRVFEGFRAGEFDKVHLIYNEFKNVMVQTRIAETFLPVEVSEDDAENASNVDYIFEPEKGEILSDLIPKAVRIQFFRALLESNASEQGARMVAMDKASENADTLLKDLKLIYNKARQAAITTEILEISAGADALGS